jgi:hypothetical protein
MEPFKTQPLASEASDGESVLVNMETANEVYREYDFSGRVYRIDRPVSVEYRLDGTTHRICDNNDVVHIVPAPGYFGCIVRVMYQPEQV